MAMTPEITCNLLATLAHPPWTKALRQNVYMTLYGEERTPFGLYIQPSGTTTDFLYPNKQLLRFNTLPAELQFQVLTFCSASTLFQLMRVSFSLRKEAYTYFVIEADWLLDGGYAGYTSNDLAFLAKVQNIQIDYDREVRDKICLLRNGIEEIQQDRIEHFWKMFQERCPRAKRVIINEVWVLMKIREERPCIAKELQHLVRSSPPGILASAFIIEKANVPADICASGPSTQNLQRAVYQLCPDGSWKEGKLGQHWKAVLVPAKRFSGPVGRIYELRYRDSLLDLKWWGLWITVVEALDRCHFDKGRNWPFSCPMDGCNVYFQVAGEWTMHAAEFHSQDLVDVYGLKMLPQGSIQDELRYRRAKLVEKKDKIDEESRKIQQQWNRGGQEQRSEMKRMWQQQLSNDPEWETGGEDWSSNRIWQEINRTLQEGEAKLSIESQV
ncbi:hypothetical protein GGP41_000580 [Bipolaris sorokiniana]|uniref:C2H2-type domain-containing protein n=1 Tax=Cochliobolus sativus TaxID=45130 RepID=A0A8H6DXX7_COCSA|nr:hypothetical protein GGP41_000580 [Bipolaris sorokiniana]